MELIGYNQHLTDMNQNLFEKLIHDFLQVHIERNKILQFFDWTKLRPTRFSRSTKLFSVKKSQRKTIDAVLGKDESIKRKEQVKKIEGKFNANRIKESIKNWEELWDDFGFFESLE